MSWMGVALTDATTRFHFSELFPSVLWRAGQIALIGVSPLSLSIWQTALMVSILSHHSNLRLPIEVERRLQYFIVTPCMRGIHHSIIHGEEDSDRSSGLTIWDYQHGTLKLNVPQSKVTLGVPAYREQRDVLLTAVIALSFKKQRPTCQLPENGEPARNPVPLSPPRLLR